MRHESLMRFLSSSRGALAQGPVAILMAEDAVEAGSTLRHHMGQGFAAAVVLAHSDLDLRLDPASDSDGRVHRVDFDVHAPDGRAGGRAGGLAGAVNRLIEAAPGTWFYCGYNAEYLFYPFCETRSIAEMLAFHAEERRFAMPACVVDLYAGDLGAAPGGVSVGDAMMDRTGYYALSRPDPANDGRPRARQLDYFGGLRWRFEEHVAPDRRRIDRIAIFRAAPGLRMRADFTFSDEEYNTYACPWHHNLTAAVASFRAAKALKANPGSTFDIADFRWRNSVPFTWGSRQLMDLGLMEPGQWF